MKILGIDQSLLACGLVVIDHQEQILHSETFGYTIEGKTEKEKINRYLKIAHKILDVAKLQKIDLVGMEGIGVNQKGRLGNQISLIELSGVLKSQIYLGLKKSPIIVAPSTWKKEVVGNGRAKKTEVKKFLKESYTLKTQDEYDALGIALYVRRAKALAINARMGL